MLNSLYGLYYKKFILLILIFSLVLSSFFLIKIKVNFFLKVIFFFILLIFFLSLLTIFEITSSLTENLVFWLVISIFLSYFYLYAGLILFILSFLKTILNQSIVKNSLKIPFSFLVSKNYNFILLSFFLISYIYFYQNLIFQESLPLSFLTFQKISNSIDKIFYFLKINFSLKEKVDNFFLNFLKKYQLPPLFLDILNKSLPQESFERIIFDLIQETWQNYKLRKIYVLSFLSTIFLIFYPLLRIFSFLIGWLSLLLYYFYIKINFVKINFKSTNKEILEL